MTTITFDTREYSKTLQEAGMPQKQAEAIATAQKKAVQEVVNAQQFATKGDIQALDSKISDTKHELMKWMFAFFLAQNAIFVGLLAFMK